MKNIISLIGVIALAILGSGCMAVNSGNVGKGIKPLPYTANEVAQTTIQTMSSTSCDGTVVTWSQTNKTGLQVNAEIQQSRINMATQVGVAQANKPTVVASYVPSPVAVGYGYGYGDYGHSGYSGGGYRGSDNNGFSYGVYTSNGGNSHEPYQANRCNNGFSYGVYSSCGGNAR